MMPMAPSLATTMISRTHSCTAGLLRTLLIGLTAFLTVVDLFATQAILPALTRAYGTTPAVMSFAVNASTIGMAISGLAMALFGRRVDRRLGILLSLALLSVPTLLLASMPNLVVFAALRVVQGLLHGRRLHADAGLYRRDQHARRAPHPPSLPTSPAMSRATCSAGCCRRRWQTISAWPGTSMLSRR